MLKYIKSLFFKKSYHYTAVPNKEYFEYINYYEGVKDNIDSSVKLQCSVSFKKFGKLHKYKRDTKGLVISEIENYKIVNHNKIADFNKEREGVKVKSKDAIREEYKKVLREQLSKAIRETPNRSVVSMK